MPAIHFICFILDNDNDTSSHGPYSGGDHFLYLKGRGGPNADYTVDQGRVMAPMYQQSSTECRLDLYYYINGNTGNVLDDTESPEPAALGICSYLFKRILKLATENSQNSIFFYPLNIPF